MAEIKLPALGENIASGTVVRVAVKEGDTVKEGQTIIEVEAEKASIEVPSPAAGEVKKIAVKKGEEIRVGQAIMTIEPASGEKTDKKEEKEPSGEAEGEEKKREKDKTEGKVKRGEESEKEKESGEKKAAIEEAPEEKRAGSKKRVDKERPARPPEDVPAAPSVRRLAREIGVDIAGVNGSGPEGIITEDDVKRYAREALAACAKGQTGMEEDEETLPDFSRWGDIERAPMGGVRVKIMQHLGWASRTVAQVAHFDKANVTKLEELLKRFSTKGRKLTITPFMVKVVASALKVFPQFNVSADVRNRELVRKKYYHVGVAVDTERGLLVPVVRDVDRKNIFQVADELDEFVTRARERKLKIEEMQGGCITVTNLGGIGGIAFTPIVHWPEVAILGVSRSRWEPVYRDGAFAPQRVIVFSLCYDHRFIDGALAAKFLRWIAEAAEQPFLLELEG